jgi:hypothetical protein
VADVRLAADFRHPIESGKRSRLAALYRETFPEAAAAETLEAARLMAHRFTLLGHQTDHGDRISWSRDPVSGREWSRGFSPDIPYRGPERLGDIKLPWELNKHQYFFTLGKVAWLGGDRGNAVEIVHQIDDWIADNPFQSGINWISALEVGSRAVSWILAYPFYADCCDADFTRRLLDSLAQHFSFVERHLSHGPFANTHLIGEAAALVAGGLFLDCPRSATWVAQGLAILEEEIQRQVTLDGIHAERSVAYHRFCLDQYYLVAGLLAANGRTFKPETLTRVEAMTSFLMHVLFPDGTSPAFGDADDARGLWFRADCPTEYRGLLALGAVLFDRGDFKQVAGTVSEEVFWLLGVKGVTAFATLAPRLPDAESIAYDDAGYYVMRGGWRPSDPVLVFDGGPVGFGSAGHGHSDALSFQLHTAEYTFLADSGTFSYNLDYQWRNVFRTSRAHNVLMVDMQDQSVPGDRMSWASVAKAQVRGWITSPWVDLVDGTHDGYRRLPDPVEHRRVVAFIKPDLWVIWDLLTAQERHRLELLLHVKPDCRIDIGKEGAPASLRSPKDARLLVWTSSDTGEYMPFDIIRGTDHELGAWFSDSYGRRVPSQALTVTSEFVGHRTLMTCLSTAERPSISTEHGIGGFHLCRDGHGREDFWYRADGSPVVGAAGVRFDGGTLFHRTSQTAPRVILATQFRELSLDGELTIQSAAAIDELRMSDNRCALKMGSDDTSQLHIAAADGIAVLVNGRPLRANSK